MTNPILCSFFIPARKRPVKIDRAITTIHETASGRDFEVLVRLDYDDRDNVPVVEKWANTANVQFFYGPRYPYGELYKTHQPLIDAAKGRWVWIFNDDFEIKCDVRPWDELLAAVPTTGVYCQPEIHKLNESIYPKDKTSCAPCFPNGSWNLISFADRPKGEGYLGSQCDHQIPDGLEALGWRCHFLDGVTIWHNRATPEQVAKEHQI